MYEFECLSDSSTSSTSKNINDLLDTPNKDSDCDSDSTIIDMSLDNITKKYGYYSGNITEFSNDEYNVDTEKPVITTYDDFSLSRADLGVTVASTTKTSFFNKKIAVNDDKPLTPVYTNKILNNDPELELLIKKYAKPLLTSTDSKKLTNTPSSTFTSSSLIELSSDEDNLPQIQTNGGNSTSSDASSSTRQQDKICLDNELHDEDEDLPCIKLNSRKLLSSRKTEQNLTDIDFSKKYKLTLDDFDHDDGSSNNETNCLNNIQQGHLQGNSSACNSPKRKRKISPDKEKRKLERAAKQMKKREETERAKLLKQTIVAANKNLKPEECMKFITVLLDTEIASEKYGGEILNALQAADITYRLQSQTIPFTITWTRKLQKHVMDDSEQLMPISETVETDELLLIMNWKQVVELVHSHSLLTHVKSLQSILTNKKLSLGIYGLESYFKYQRKQKQRDVRSEITQQSQKTNNKDDKKFKEVSKINRKQLEFALTELQLMCCCCYRMVETPQDLGMMITQFTKAIAQAPYKLEKSQKQQEAKWYISGDNRDCVKVDKNGNGLQRLWQQQLTTFPLARLEHAEAIITKYPTPSSLMEEYSGCTQSQGEKLLQDIPIRRAAGPLTTVRKIGPELSRKMYKFFTSTDGDIVL